MQAVDYKFRFKFFRTLRHSWQQEKFRIFYKGLFATLFAQCYLYAGVIAGHLMKKYEKQSYFPAAFFVSTLFAHPFYVVAMRLQYGLNGGTKQNNMFKMFAEILAKDGTRGLYRGYLPSAIVCSFMFMSEILEIMAPEDESSSQVISLEISEKEGENDTSTDLESFKDYGEWIDQKEGESYEDF